MTSIRRRLLAILLTSFAIAWLLLATMTYFSARQEIEELFDAELAQSARVLLSLTLHELQEEGDKKIEPGIIGYKTGHVYEGKIAFQIWKQNRLMLRSPNSPKSAMGKFNGYHDQVIDGNQWRVFALYSPKYKIRIIVGERYDVRNELIYEIMLDTLLPILLILPLLALLIWIGVGRGLWPMRKITKEIGRRSPEQLSPLQFDAGSTPAEIQPLTQSLNELLIKLKQAFERERRFTADAAHELRTPLAGLKAQAEVALRATKDDDRGKALRQIVNGVDRATHLLEQLLTLARLDPEVAMAGHQRVDLTQLATKVVAELAPLALEKQIDIRLDKGGPSEILGHQATLAILLRNLLDNAIRYTTAGGEVVVAVTADDKTVVLSVTDSGPGIPPGEREQVFERFRRLRPNHAPGCGLGLSIVRRICELHQGQIALETPASGSGLQVNIRFPAANSA